MRYVDVDKLIGELKSLPEQERIEYMGIYDCVKSIPTATENSIEKGMIIRLDETAEEVTVNLESCNINRKQDLMTIANAMIRLACEYGVVDGVLADIIGEAYQKFADELEKYAFTNASEDGEEVVEVEDIENVLKEIGVDE